MLGYTTKDNGKDPVAWGHITCGGTVANIEAMWAARNLKFHPLAVQTAIRKEEGLARAFKLAVYVPRLGGKRDLVSLDTWDLMNLRVDDVIGLLSSLAEESGLSIQEASDLVKKYSLESVGLGKFFADQNITEQPVILSPASNHYSWPKGMTLLGLGDANILPIAVDATGRQNVNSLKEKLNECLSKKIPVMAVVAVIGTTEEGAIDPLEDILAVKKEFEKKGLTFSVHGDAAWGGYLCTLLGKNESKQFRKVSMHAAYVYSSPLNEYSKKHLKALAFSDSITVDPHKTGFIPYPAGGLCYRNGSMRNFTTLTAPVVFHGGSDPNIGVYGIEGSKPGAAAVATVLSHRVIGLNADGHGRIMAQCISGAKLFYCLWLTVATEDDPFTCMPLFPLPSRMTLETAKKFIRKKMGNKSFGEMVKDKDVKNFLATIGGDAMVNPFIINIKGNTDVSVANKLMMSVFRKLSYTNALTSSNRKVPLILTQSEKNKDIGVDVLRKLKKMVGLVDTDDSEPLSFLINTVLNPWLGSSNMVQDIGKMFKEAVLIAVGEIKNNPHNHGFISAGLITDDGFIIGDHLPVFTEEVHQYHAIAKFKILSPDAIKKFKDKQLQLRALPKDQRSPVIFGNPDPMTLPNLVLSEGRVFTIDCFAGLPSDTNPPFMTEKAMVVDVIRFSHFDMTQTEYPEKLPYWLFGDANGTFISHVMTKRPDMHQLVALDSPPYGIDAKVLELGLPIEIPSLSGKSFLVEGKQMDPLQLEEYDIQYQGKFGKLMKTSIRIGGEFAKIWTDFTELNVEGHHHENEDQTKPPPTASQPFDMLFDKNISKYITNLDGCYGMGRVGYDPESPAHPGDVIAIRGYEDRKFTVDLVVPKPQVLGVTGPNNEKGVIRYHLRIFI